MKGFRQRVVSIVFVSLSPFWPCSNANVVTRTIYGNKWANELSMSSSPRPPTATSCPRKRAPSLLRARPLPMLVPRHIRHLVPPTRPRPHLHRISQRLGLRAAMVQIVSPPYLLHQKTVLKLASLGRNRLILALLDLQTRGVQADMETAP